MLEIYLIRHGRQSSGLCNVDVELSKEGRKQAELVGKRLKECGIQAVYSSHLIRAMETAEIIRRENGLDIVEKFNSFEGFRETDFGELTGLSDAMIQEKYGDFLKSRDERKEDVRIPGGENGEEVYERFIKALDVVIDYSLKNNHKKIAIVSHGGAIRCFLAGILEIPQKNRYMLVKNMENCSITQLNYYENKKMFSLETVNDYGHILPYKELLRENFKKPLG